MGKKEKETPAGLLDNYMHVRSPGGLESLIIARESQAQQ